MTLRTKLAAFHARIHSHRHNHHHHFHLPHLRHKSSKDSKDKEKPSSSPSRKCSKKSSSSPSSPSHKPSNRDSVSSTSTTTTTSSSTTPSPILTLILPIPSHHSHTIEARVYHPSEFPQNYGLTPSTPRKAAVIAHPYASLGGTWDDPVVLSLVALLTRKGWVVATFNFCGAGNSKGKTSWTGDREREEYATVTAFLVKYVECIDPHMFTVVGSPSTTTAAAAAAIPALTNPATETTPLKKQPIKFLLAGYSYGSLIASRTPSASHVLKTVDKDILAYATRTAYEWASTEKRRSFAMVRGAALGRSVWANNDDDGDYEEEEGERGETSREGGGVDEKVNYNVQLETESSWLLVSPLLPPVSMFLNLPNPMAWFPTKKKKQQEEEEDVEDDFEDERDVFAVFGTDDMFTGIGRYRNWVKGKVERSNGRFRGVEVDGAGHFWMQEEEWMVKLREGVAGWIDEKSVLSSV
ncbi:hypothetical protein TWF788_001992 [Orbilia oligospora]|uniref:AB hydrolase-1 domain-containing protein n=1 Tax=Orbilia oligospora TaxID=2813651 RepID=A0A7C8K754_ORBOL|nr:hypothetical protein TWF788_001992 [Orbilia oligospora]